VGANHKTDVKLGIASYSLRAFSLEESLDMTIRCGLNRINLKSMHLPLDSNKEAIKKAVLLCKKRSGALRGGVIYTILILKCRINNLNYFLFR